MLQPIEDKNLPAPHSGPAHAPTWHSHVTVITGTIGSGKSTLVRELAARGVCTVMSDEVGRELDRNPEYLAEVVRHFGPEVVRDGQLDRKKLGAIVFSDPAKRTVLESIAHPRILALIGERFAEPIARGASPLVLEIAAFFEGGFDALGFKRVVLVTASDDTCLQRVLSRDRLPEAEARKRIAAQWPVAEKIARADIVIENSGSQEELERKVDELLATI